jgi:hypothetical protein
MITLVNTDCRCHHGETAHGDNGKGACEGVYTYLDGMGGDEACFCQAYDPPSREDLYPFDTRAEHRGER